MASQTMVVRQKTVVEQRRQLGDREGQDSVCICVCVLADICVMLC